MVALYVRGAKVGTVEEDAPLLARLIESGEPVEFRTTAGQVRRVVDGAELICPWEPELTEEEIAKRIAEPGGSTLAEFWRTTGAK